MFNSSSQLHFTGRSDYDPEPIRPVSRRSEDPFSYPRAKIRQEQEEEEKKNSNSGSKPVEFSEEENNQRSDATFFNLIDFPNFSDFLRLQPAREGQQLFFLVKKARTGRGISENQILAPAAKTSEKYLHRIGHIYKRSIHFYEAPNGNTFTGNL